MLKITKDSSRYGVTYFFNWHFNWLFELRPDKLNITEIARAGCNLERKQKKKGLRTAKQQKSVMADDPGLA